MEKGKQGYRYDDAFKREAVAFVKDQKLPVAYATAERIHPSKYI